MKLTNAELRLVMDIFSRCKVDCRLDIYGDFYCNVPIEGSMSSGITLENDTTSVNILDGSIDIKFCSKLLLAMEESGCELSDSALNGFMWATQLRANKIIVDGEPAMRREELFERCMDSYMKLNNTRCLVVHGKNFTRSMYLMYTSNRRVIRVFTDKSTVKDSPYLIVFESSLAELFDHLPCMELISVTLNREVYDESAYYKQLARLCKHKYKDASVAFKVVGR